jgi:hypothetical protein
MLPKTRIHMREWILALLQTDRKIMTSTFHLGVAERTPEEQKARAQE